MTDPTDLSSAIDALSGANVMVIGDLMLDRFVYGEVERISPEAPVPVIRVGAEESMLGGAGNVVRNLLALGAEVCFVAVVGDDQIGRDLIEMVAEEERVEPYLLVERGRRSTTKVRYVAGGQQLLRADRETERSVDEATQARIIDIVATELEGVSALVLSDYAKGVLTSEVVEALIGAARDAEVPVIVDPKSHDFARYRGATVLTPNRRELSLAARMMAETDEEVVSAATRVMGDAEADFLLVTRSADGMSLVHSDGNAVHLPAEAREVYDVSGAGDTVVATFAAALGRGLDPTIAAQLANLAGGIVVGKTGTAVVDLEDLHRALHSQEFTSNETKVVSGAAAHDLVRRWQNQGKRVGFTNGCFDLLHPGHVSLLRQARSHCDRLVVGLNSDNSVRLLKGPERPVQNEMSRAQVLASMADVDVIVVYEDETPLALIESLRPDVLVKGADYTIDEVVGAKEVQGYGGEVVLAELADGHSTTAMVARMAT
ncbi:MAG: D-glycero-beta-D-manno-heptose-7-phosphate kinase [Alphaproteobacteria bacterium]|nr:D-glycero-beta-D-manno-heptose-7-phosphate kinase [Rhodospirillaceae bacterium]MBT7648751.1 D-glycero-beta-D-manno-heptose-7-phosphate kinase [Rhodospirillaceae bacterium]MDG2480079.1 D-glycero-beta-D-manno-heptose-7-phosphate kinase [Alphaproteobacteria bacterium]